MKPERIRIDVLWTNLAAMWGLTSVSDVQRREMRKAFYAGFLDCFALMKQISDQLPEDKAAEVLSALEIEAIEFAQKEIERS